MSASISTARCFSSASCDRRFATLGRAASMRAPPGSRAPRSAYSNSWRKPSLVSFPLPLISRQLFVEPAGLHCHRGRSGASPAQPGLHPLAGSARYCRCTSRPSSTAAQHRSRSTSTVAVSLIPLGRRGPLLYHIGDPQQPLPHCFAHHFPFDPRGSTVSGDTGVSARHFVPSFG